MLIAMNRLFWSPLLLVAGLAFPCVEASAADAESSVKKTLKEETWNVIYLSGQRIGYSQSIVETVQKDGIDVVRTSTMTNMTIKRFGQTLILKQSLSTEETSTGDLRRFRYEMANPPAAPTVTSGKIEGLQLSLTQEVNGSSKTTVQEWKPDVKSPVYQDRLLKENPLKPGETRTLETFVPEFAKVGKITMKGYDWENTGLLNKESRKLFKVASTQTLLPGITTDSFQDEHGDTLKSSSNMLGSTIEMFAVSQAEALKSIEGAELDLAVSTLIKVKPIVKGHDTRRITYRVTISGQNPVDAIPAGDTQSLRSLDPETAELTVISLPIPASSKIGDVPSEFLESSQYLQRDDERVRKHANRACGDATDPGEIARRLEKYVLEKLDKKNFSTAMASAAEVAQSMEGDCTEHAVLLAAMLRSKGIPSRVVVGLVYADRLFAFGGHMWTEANLNGQWIPLDATLGNGGIGAAHIKLADSSLSDDGPVAISGFAPLMTVIGKLTLEVISAE